MFYLTGLLKMIFKKAKDWFPEVYGCNLVFHPAPSPHDSELYHITFDVPKDIFNFHIPNEPLLYGE